MTIKSLAAIALAAATIPSAAQAQTIININSVYNASSDGSNALEVALGAGTYRLNFVQGVPGEAATFTAFNRFFYSLGETGGCDSNGLHCGIGYENSFKYVIGDQTFGFGDDNDNGDGGPVGPGSGYYSTAALSFANSNRYTGTFTLATPTTVGFYIFDKNVGDNAGGVSVSISAVPEPATWGMMVLGFGMVGFGLRGRRKVSAKSSFA